MATTETAAVSLRPGEPEGRPPALVEFHRFERPPTVWHPVDAFLYNLTATNVAVSFGILFVAGTTFYYPLNSLTVAILVAGAFTVLEALVYALLVPTFPRNGGDYLYQTRLLPRWVGSTVSLAGVVVGGALWMAIAGWFASRLVVGPFLVITGYATGLTALVKVGGWVMSPAGVIAMGLAATAWSAVLNWLGMRRYARLQRVLLVLGLACVVTLIAYLSLTTLSINESGYKAILYRALEVGFGRRGRIDGLEAVLQLLPLVAFGLIYPGWVTYQAGEVQESTRLRPQLFAIVGGKVAGVFFALVLLPLPIHHVGEELFGASAYLAIKDPTSFWILAPRLFSTNETPWLAVVTLISFCLAVNVWFWLWVPSHTLAASRVLLAMCWDRLAPAWLGPLDRRTGAPTRAILTFSALSVAFCCGAYVLGQWRLVVLATVLSLITFAVTSIAAALLPFTRRELYRSSPAARFEFGRIPLITVAGVAFTGFAGFLLWRYAAMGALAERPLPTGIGLALSAVFVACLAAYLALSRRQNRLEGTLVHVFYRLAEADGSSETTASGKLP